MLSWLAVTGKTLVALWAVEQLKPKTVLVLVPSLTLLQQTLDEWSRQNNWGKDFTYLCVCSDPTVISRDEYDPVQLKAMDLEFRACCLSARTSTPVVK